MIYPGGRWIHQSGKGLQQFGKELINDKTLASIDFYPEAREVFGDAASIADGITIVVKNKNKQSEGFEYSYIHNGEKETVHTDNPGDDLMPLYPKDNAILKKVKAFVKNNDYKFLHDAILPRTLFGIESDFVSKHPKAVKLYKEGKKLKDGEIKLLANDKAGKAGRSTWYIASKTIIPNNPDKIEEWQVVVSSANAGGQKRDNQLEIMDNRTAFGRSRVALRSFKTREEAENFYRYVRTYIVRYTFLMTDEALTSLGKVVPDIIDYTSNNNKFDFNSTLDAQLFKKIGLTDDEIDYIKHTVDSIR